MNDTPVPIWIIANNEGTVLSAHCLACKAGLAECCSHIGSVLFYIEAWNCIHGKLAWGVTKTKTLENEDLRPVFVFVLRKRRP